MIGRFVRQVGLFSVANNRIPSLYSSAPRRRASSDDKQHLVSARSLFKHREDTLSPRLSTLVKCGISESKQVLGTVKLQHEIMQFMSSSLAEIEKVRPNEAILVKDILIGLIDNLFRPDAQRIDIHTDTLISSFNCIKDIHPLSNEISSFAVRASNELKNRELDIKKISIDDSWKDIYKQGIKSVEIISIGCFNNILAQHSEELLDWIATMANSSNPTNTASELRSIERHYQPEGKGPLRSAINNWWLRFDELNNSSIILNPRNSTGIAVYNLAIVASKLMRDVYNYQIQSPEISSKSTPTPHRK